MKKLNKKGFALTEILIVSAFVATTFTLLYTNVLPLMGTYESYENYDTIDTKYTAYYMRRFLSSGYVNKDELIKYKNKLITKKNCTDDSPVFNNSAMCKYYFKYLRIDSMYFTTFATNSIKYFVNNSTDSSNIDKDLISYINYLPNYSIADGYPNKQNLYRVIIKMHNNDTKKFYYGTIEVDI